MNDALPPACEPRKGVVVKPPKAGAEKFQWSAGDVKQIPDTPKR